MKAKMMEDKSFIAQENTILRKENKELKQIIHDMMVIIEEQKKGLEK